MARKPIQLTMAMSRSRTSHLRAGALRRKEAVTEALKQALDGCRTLDGAPIDRETVAKELSRLVGETVSVHTLNNWCAEGKENRRLPLEYAEALALITGDRRILDAALGQNFRVLDETDSAYLELGKIVADERERSKRKRQVLERIEG